MDKIREKILIICEDKIDLEEKFDLLLRLTKDIEFIDNISNINKTIKTKDFIIYLRQKMNFTKVGRVHYLFNLNQDQELHQMVAKPMERYRHPVWMER